MTSSRHLIIHGHFYQPPRQNPWSGTVPIQPSAAPYANWNQRISRECYSPNTVARILGDRGLITKILNNFEHISFNVGPTLLLWLKEADRETYDRIVAADRAACAAHGGHGSAMAQVFNHVILPLANERDRLTQVAWGKAFFRSTFGREPEGMWLAETAASLGSLEALGRHGIRFTVLAQNQVDALRPLSPGGGRGAGPFAPLEGQADPREPYRIFWGDGPDDHIDAFVYDGQVSRAVAFENLLLDGGTFLGRVEGAFGAPKDGPVLVNVATDGESYGHHFHFGEMALAWLLNAVLAGRAPGGPIRLTNYGEFLALHPPTKEARLVEDSSWSCAHGVERWRSDCGCRTGGDPGWNQRWRAPLREGLDWLRDELIEVLERESGGLFRDPWEARDAYIEVLMAGYEQGAVEAFLRGHSLAGGDPGKATRALTLMESQLMSMFMFTSCAWFFDDLAGLEPIQNLRYAQRAIELCQPHTPRDLAKGLLSFLRKAVPNDRKYPTGEDIWRNEVLGAVLNADQAAAQWGAALAMNAPRPPKEAHYTRVRAESSERTPLVQGEDLPQLLTGSADFTEIRLLSTDRRSVLVLADNGPRLDIVVAFDDRGFERARQVFQEGGPDSLRAGLDKLFPGAHRFTLDSLWPGVREDILTHALKDFFEDLLLHTSRAFNNYKDAILSYSLKTAAWDWMDAFVFRVMAENDLAHILKPMADGRPIDMKVLKGLLSLDSGGYTRNTPVISEASAPYLKNLFRQLKFGPGRPTLLEEIAAYLRLVKSTLKDVDLWDSQNQYHSLLENRLSFLRSISEPEKALLREIGQILGFSEGITESIITSQPT